MTSYNSYKNLMDEIKNILFNKGPKSEALICKSFHDHESSDIQFALKELNDQEVIEPWYFSSYSGTIWRYVPLYERNET